MKIVKIVPTWGLMCTANPHPVVPWALGTGPLGIHSGKWCHLEAGIVAGE